MADEWAYEEASEQEKLQLAQHFLLSSPPGQVHEVVRDVAKLVPPRVLTDAALRGALHAYNVQSLLPVDVPDADYKASCLLFWRTSLEAVEVADTRSVPLSDPDLRGGRGGPDALH